VVHPELVARRKVAFHVVVEDEEVLADEVPGLANDAVTELYLRSSGLE